MGKNKLLQAPPYAVENSIKRLGANLRIARLRRNLSIQHMANIIGTGPRAVADAEKGKLATGAAVYAALLWALGLLEQLNDVADPTKDEIGKRLALSKERTRARQGSEELDNDF